MTVERQLREWFGVRAAAASPSEDLVDLMGRVDRRSRTRARVLVTVLVVALLAGPLGGFIIGRTTYSDDRSRVVAANGNSDGSASGGGVHSPTGGARPLGKAELDRLFVRTTRDGITARAYARHSRCAPSDFCVASPPPYIQADLSSDAAVTVVASSPNSPATAPLGSVMSGLFGVAEGAPSLWVLVQTGPEVTQVRARFSGDDTDRMSPVDNVAILAHQGASAARIEALNRSGEVVATRDIPVTTGSCGAAESSTSANGPQSIVPSCSGPAPPTLPAAGPQPANPAAATAGVTAAFTAAYKGDTPGAARASAVTDNTGIAALLEQVAHGQYASSVKISSARVAEIVFISPTEAAVRFDILLGIEINFGNRIGQALFTNGSWKVSRATLCSDLARAGAPCG
jgi:hypothetical protein